MSASPARGLLCRPHPGAALEPCLWRPGAPGPAGHARASKKRASDCQPPGCGSATCDLVCSSAPASNGCLRRAGKLRFGTSFSVCIQGPVRLLGLATAGVTPPLLRPPEYNPPARCVPFPPRCGFCPGPDSLSRHLGDHSHFPEGFSTSPCT